MTQACDYPDHSDEHDERTCSLGVNHTSEHFFNVPRLIEHPDGDYFYPHDITYGVQLTGVYDGEAYLLLRDGRLVNKFRGEGSRRERATQNVIDGIMRDREKADV